VPKHGNAHYNVGMEVTGNHARGCRYCDETAAGNRREWPPFVSVIEDHWYMCRYCREVGPCEEGAELAQHAKTYGDQREWKWAVKILAGL